MRAAVEGDWTLTLTPDSGSPLEVTVHIEQAASAARTGTTSGTTDLVRSAHACGTRTLIRPAAACVDSTEMPLAVTFVSGDASLANANMSGSFDVPSLVFSTGHLRLLLGTYVAEAMVSAEGSTSDARLGSGGPPGTLSLTRAGTDEK